MNTTVIARKNINAAKPGDTYLGRLVLHCYSPCEVAVSLNPTCPFCGVDEAIAFDLDLVEWRCGSCNFVPNRNQLRRMALDQHRRAERGFPRLEWTREEIERMP